MMTFSGPTDRAKIQPVMVSVVPTICEPPVGSHDLESGSGNVPVANAVAVPTAWAALNPTVMPEPAPRGQSTESYEREKILLSLYQRNRFIRFAAILDVAFIIVFGLFQPIFFILIPFPIIGYIGAKRWVYRLLFIYAVYLIIEIIGGVVSLVYIHTAAFIAVRITYVVINLIVARYVLNLASYVLVLDPEDFEFLKNSPVVLNYEKSLLC